MLNILVNVIIVTIWIFFNVEISIIGHQHVSVTQIFMISYDFEIFYINKC